MKKIMNIVKPEDVIVENEVDKKTDIETDTPQKKEDTDTFEKESDVVPSGKYNAAVRKQRELELEKRELEQRLSELSTTNPVKKVVEEDEQEEEDEDDEDFFKEDKPIKKESIKSEIVDPLSKELKELRDRIDQRDAEDMKKQRTVFFKAHPEYLTNAEKWQELLDEMDNSLNPHSKDGYYKQLTKAHRLISDDSKPQYSDIDRKKAEMAAEISDDSGSQKPNNDKPTIDERSMRLATKMPKGYEFKKN